MTSNLYILNIETATKNCSVSLSKNGSTVQIKEISEKGFSHAENLHVFIEEIIANEKINLKNLSAIAVSEGPGSYTGLRIGVSAAKGLCYALSIPLIAINTLEILARNISISDGFIIPMIDARRMEVYSMILNSDYSIVRSTEAEIIDETSYNTIDSKITFVGDAVEKVIPILSSNSNFNFEVGQPFPTSTYMSQISYAKFLASDFVDVAYFEPYYLKDFFLNK